MSPKATRSSKSGRSGRSGRSGKGGSSKHTKSQDEDYYVQAYCAVYWPHRGNYFHFAFAVEYDQDAFHLFQLNQPVEDGEYFPHQGDLNPTHSARCISPLTHLGQMTFSKFEELTESVTAGEIPIPGPEDPRNCQDYVLDIWKKARDIRAVTRDVWSAGKQAMTPFMGPDFGDYEAPAEAGETQEEAPDLRQLGPRGPLSEEFIVDSSGSSQ